MYGGFVDFLWAGSSITFALPLASLLSSRPVNKESREKLAPSRAVVVKWNMWIFDSYFKGRPLWNSGAARGGLRGLAPPILPHSICT